MKAEKETKKAGARRHDHPVKSEGGGVFTCCSITTWWNFTQHLQFVWSDLAHTHTQNQNMSTAWKPFLRFMSQLILIHKRLFCR